MATGAGLQSILPAVMALFGIVTILRARRARRTGTVPMDQSLEKRQAEAAEMERRMASYLAGRQSVGWNAADDGDHR